MHPVIRGVEHDGVVGDLQLIQLIQHLAHQFVVGHHHIIVKILAGFTQVLFRGVGAEVHAGGIHPGEERFVRLYRFLHELLGGGDKFLIGSLHTLARQGPCILYASVCVGANHAARAKHFTEGGILGVIHILGLLLGVEVVEVAEKLIEAMIGRQVLILVPQVILAKLAGGITVGLQDFSDRDVPVLNTQLGTGHAHFAQAGAQG